MSSASLDFATVSPIRRKHRGFALALAAGGAAALVLMAPQAWSVWGRDTFLDPDDALRTVEIRDFLAGQSWFDTVAHRLSPAHPFPMHWSRLVDAPLGGLQRPFRAGAAHLDGRTCDADHGAGLVLHCSALRHPLPHPPNGRSTRSRARGPAPRHGGAADDQLPAGSHSPSRHPGSLAAACDRLLGRSGRAGRADALRGPRWCPRGAVARHRPAEPALRGRARGRGSAGLGSSVG